MPAPRIEARLESRGFSCEGVQIVHLTGREAISSVFSFELEIAVLPPGELDPDEVLGSEVDLVFLQGGVERRRLHGLVTTVDDLLLTRSEHRAFRLQVRPRIERLTLVETQDIFMTSSVPGVIEQKLLLAGFKEGVDFRFALSATYEPRELVVQYRETDLAFISRLAEHLGISFFFEHVTEADRDQVHDRVVFTDHGGELPPTPGRAVARFRPDGDELDVTALESRRAIMPSFWAQLDYNYRIPTVDLVGSKEVDAYGGGVLEYGAHVKTPEEARALAEVRAEERAALCRFHRGASELCELTAGHTFVLLDHPLVKAGTSFLVVEVEHTLAQVVGAHGGDAPQRYENRFRAVLAASTYRPPRITPRPRIHGLVTGVISPIATGAAGAAAQLDDHGRYRVRFHFDGGPLDARPAPSHPVRMIQQFAGPNYGTHFPLKPGTEVQVAFLDGDPDRPVIVGAVPNPITPSPVASIDASKHRIKTASGVIVEMGEQAKARSRR